jgi:hypothetical protein
MNDFRFLENDFLASLGVLAGCAVARVPLLGEQSYWMVEVFLFHKEGDTTQPAVSVRSTLDINGVADFTGYSGFF